MTFSENYYCDSAGARSSSTGPYFVLFMDLMLTYLSGTILPSNSEHPLIEMTDSLCPHSHPECNISLYLKCQKWGIRHKCQFGN